MEMQTGEIYLLDNTAGYKHSIVLHEKVISCDTYEVFADSKSIEAKNWDLDNPKKKTAIFVRSSMINFERWSSKISYEPYSDERLLVLRPDLPMRICRIRNISWGDKVFENEESICRYIAERNFTFTHTRLMAKQVCLEGYSKNEVPQKPVILTAKNGMYFTLEELLYHANIIQTGIKANKNFKSEGVGIYRSGIIKGIPSYYVWGFYDLANNLRNYEKQGIDIEYA